MVVDISKSSTQCLEEFFLITDENTKKLLDNWKTGNEAHTKKEFKTSTITDEEYLNLKNIVTTIKDKDTEYAEYKKAFNALCKFCHIVPNGTIITKYELSKSKDDDRNNLYVEYTENTRSITLPEGTILYHQTVVGGIKELIPRWKLRGKNENGYLCDKPRVYLTLNKSLPRISTDNKLTSKMHTYVTLSTPKEVFIDPLLPDTLQKAVYVETTKPIPVKEIEPEKLIDKISNLISINKKG